ncbi:alcohol dehydrogenase (NADP(+)) [Malassezia vespertilionis]|uniref:Enoyl reductase (ER) domain-containing protein n=1 Tax=Malassezia vespertilionis TaxID=2020962 RepID=A0A2N1JFM8_9BASI|nr:alcohol dehydrogenase (NADP(+)) [Malassezia vespertilionis]PKI85347.1 hypothetical protein MVES_000130 [Malassezia vespertilionis]WFD04807.1 alcohol dehydrogenase (NADP(+)) [Malassezia vespertilionis]
MTEVDLGTVFKGSESGEIVKAKGETIKLGPGQVVIDIAYSGLCGTDQHFRHNPNMVLGHEGVGIISQVDPLVKHYKVGDRVGWGYNHEACGFCNHCWNGRDVICPDRKMYGVADLEWGSFGDRAVLNEFFIHRIPDNYPLRLAGPLQCGGATVYSAILNAESKPGQRVGVLGLGGLGHLAVQYLNKMGLHVTVISSSNSKREQALELGASEFIATKENPDFKGVLPLDALYVSTSFQPEWDQVVKVMAPGGALVPLTVSDEEFRFPYSSILLKELRVIGSLVARRQVHREMMEFSALNDVRPMVEELPMTEEGLNKAFARLEKGDVRYRFVLKSQRTDAD